MIEDYWKLPEASARRKNNLALYTDARRKAGCLFTWER